MAKQFSFDLLNDLRSNPARLDKVSNQMRLVDSVAALMREGKASREDLAKAQAALVPMCGFNFGLLMPHFFPRYPIDKPLSLVSRPFMFAMTCIAPGAVITLKAGRQIGKCADEDTEVTTPDGKLTLGDIFNSGEPMLADA